MVGFKISSILQASNAFVMRYPIGIQCFEELIRRRCVYVDKTDLMYRLATDGGKQVFLSRPRRFGKSLLLSTFEAYFSGKKELFSGLKAAALESEWRAYPVLNISFNSANYSLDNAVETMLDGVLDELERQFGLERSSLLPERRFQDIIFRLHQRSGRQVVVLVDEYDKPLLSTNENKALQEKNRQALRGFFSVLKSEDRHIRFALVVGVSRFSKVSIFSDLNHLNDISLDDRYASICGISETELHAYFDEEVEALATRRGMTKTEAYAELKENYDGYHFTPDSEGIYNPFSLLNCLDKRQLGFYWNSTGTPTILAEAIKHCNYDIQRLSEDTIEGGILGDIDTIDRTPLPIMFQSGYLTIKDYDYELDSYTLRFPNREVRQSFLSFLTPTYLASSATNSVFSARSFADDLVAGRAESFMKRIETLFRHSSYEIIPDDSEKYCQCVLYLMFTLIGAKCEVERRTSDGRIDVVVQTKDYVYIIELKMNKSADEALMQIEEKGYAKAFEMSGKRIYKIGINFNTTKRAVVQWKIA